MKKIISVLLISAILLAGVMLLTGCGEKNGESKKEEKFKAGGVEIVSTDGKVSITAPNEQYDMWKDYTWKTDLTFNK